MIARPACGLPLPDVPDSVHGDITASPACPARSTDSMAQDGRDCAARPARGHPADAGGVRRSTGDGPRAPRGRPAVSSLPAPPPQRRPSRTIADVATQGGPERSLAVTMTCARAAAGQCAAHRAAVLPRFEAA
jgi:hypothetical protein